MPLIDYRDVLKGLPVKEAMRRQVIQLPRKAHLAEAVRYTIKFKVNAVLITGAESEGLGVVSKTDLMGAYYAGLPLGTACGDIMVGPPLFCQAEDSLDTALDTMRSHRVHRLYVRGEGDRQAAGVLAYPDIVGILYRYCNRCERGLRARSGPEQALPDRLRIREVMTPEIHAYGANDSLQTVMEGLAAYRFGAVLIKTEAGTPAGVVSKTDLNAAYLHALPTDTRAREIMTAPVRAADGHAPVVDALKTMIHADVHRLFVYQDAPDHLVGVLSLSDVARFRSGTCRACLVSRIIS
jgi:CBS domain-containing protein